MTFNSNIIYYKDLLSYSSKISNIRKLRNKTILIVGSTGMIGSCLVDMIMLLNTERKFNCHIIALARNKSRAEHRFYDYLSSRLFSFESCDITDLNGLKKITSHIDYIIHAASNTHPLAYANDPIGTITTNTLGTNNILRFAHIMRVKKTLFISSVEIYGQAWNEKDVFDEKYCGYIDSNTLRAGYPEAKRCAEALCQAYIKSKDENIIIARLARTFGPTMLMSDSKASSQFIKKAVKGLNIVLKSKGLQEYSYIYSVDATAALLHILLNGKRGNAYNISNPNFNTTLKDFASLVAQFAETNVEYKLPSREESEGYSKAQRAILDSSKLLKTGYEYTGSLDTCIEKTIKIIQAQ